MKEFIKYNYDLDFENVCSLNELLYFDCNDKFYIISIFNRDEEEFEKMINFLINNNVKFLNVVINKFGSITSEFDRKKYILLESELDNQIIELPIHSALIFSAKNYWNTIWEERVAQLKKQKEELKLNKNINYILNYYIGLIEICIYNYNLIRKKFPEGVYSSVQHNRMSYPLYSFVYYNPINYLIDYHFRDFAEYLKMLFFHSEISLDYVLSVIDKLQLDDFSVNMFIVRLLYPTYFLDKYDVNKNSDVDVSDFSEIIKKSSQYENFILNLIAALSQKYNILVVVPFIFQR